MFDVNKGLCGVSWRPLRYFLVPYMVAGGCGLSTDPVLVAFVSLVEPG